MKAKIIFLGLITLYCSCQEAIRKGRPFPEVNTDSVTVIPTDEAVSYTHLTLPTNSRV